MSEIYRSKVAFQSKELFQLLNKLACFEPRLLLPTLQSLKEQVTAVENQRGRGSDQQLRYLNVNDVSIKF
jgi:S-phase genomic integrity recombination mediator, C-terminal